MQPSKNSCSAREYNSIPQEPLDVERETSYFVTPSENKRSPQATVWGVTPGNRLYLNPLGGTHDLVQHTQCHNNDKCENNGEYAKLSLFQRIAASCVLSVSGGHLYPPGIQTGCLKQNVCQRVVLATARFVLAPQHYMQRRTMHFVMRRF